MVLKINHVFIWWVGHNGGALMHTTACTGFELGFVGGRQSAAWKC